MTPRVEVVLPGDRAPLGVGASLSPQRKLHQQSKAPRLPRLRSLDLRSQRLSVPGPALASRAPAGQSQFKVHSPGHAASIQQRLSGTATSIVTGPVHLAPRLRIDCSCLSACFSTPQWVGYRGAQAVHNEEPPGVPGAVRQRGSVRGLPDRVPLARGFRLPKVPSRGGVCLGGPPSVAVRLLPLTGVGDGRDRSPQLEDAAHDVVLGRVPDDDRQAWSLGLAPAPARDRPLRASRGSPRPVTNTSRDHSRSGSGCGRAPSPSFRLPTG